MFLGLLTATSTLWKFISVISNIVDNVKMELNTENLVLADGFSGSGIISRLFKMCI